MLRHEVAVLRRQVNGQCSDPADRALLAGSRARSLAQRRDASSSSPTPSFAGTAISSPTVDLPHRPPGCPPVPVGNGRPGPTTGRREPDLGLPAHRWRARHHGHPDRPVECLGEPGASRHRTLAQAIGTDLGRVPRAQANGLLACDLFSVSIPRYSGSSTYSFSSRTTRASSSTPASPPTPPVPG